MSALFGGLLTAFEDADHLGRLIIPPAFDAAMLLAELEAMEQRIVRLDKLSRNEDLQTKLAQVDWDLIVCDEAHKMSASFFGGEIKETKRYKLGKLLSTLIGQTHTFLHNLREDAEV